MQNTGTLRRYKINPTMRSSAHPLPNPLLPRSLLSASYWSYPLRTPSVLQVLAGHDAFPLPAHSVILIGTYLGDYFGILMDHRVEGFPFNILTDPMYDGSTMCFVAIALWYAPRRDNCLGFVPNTSTPFTRYGRPSGLFISAFIYIVYGIALRFEGFVSIPFR